MPAENATTVAATVGPIAPPSKPQRASASTRAANPRDLTGKRKQQLEAQHAEQLAETERQMAVATARAATARAEGVVDYSEGGSSAPSVAPAEGAPLISEEPEEFEVENLIVRIRVNSPIEDMVFGRRIVTMDVPGEGGVVHQVETGGHLQFYNFQEGISYDVPKALADHLDRLGYLYH